MQASHWNSVWRRQGHPTPILLPGKSHGRRSLVGCSPWGGEESDTTEWLHFHFSLSCIGEGNGNPLQCFFLENPRDGGAWWAAGYGVAQSWTGLKRLSSSSSTLKGEFWTWQSNYSFELEVQKQNNKMLHVYLHTCVYVWRVKSLSRVRPSVTPWTAAFQAPLSMGFPRQEYRSGLQRVGHDWTTEHKELSLVWEVTYPHVQPSACKTESVNKLISQWSRTCAFNHSTNRDRSFWIKWQSNEFFYFTSHDQNFPELLN